MEGKFVALFVSTMVCVVLLALLGEQHFNQRDKQACLDKGGEYAKLYRGHLCVRPGILVEEK